MVMDVCAHEVRIDGEATPLTAREFELLEHLARHPRQILTRGQLFERFWGEFGDRHSLTVHVSRLREKIEEDPAHPRLIVTRSEEHTSELPSLMRISYAVICLKKKKTQ